MSSTKTQRKTVAERNAQMEKIQRHITEVCDREGREFVREWLTQRRQERQGVIPKTPK